MSAKKGFSAILAMAIGISVLHYITGASQPAGHVVYSKLYYIPVTLGGLLYGLRGGLLSGFLVAACYGPSFVVMRHGSDVFLLDFALELLILLGTGALIGAMVDRERRQHRRAQEAERLAALGRTAAVMAHEIKTPLVTIGGFSRSLLRGTAGQREREKLEIIVAETGRLERLVHDALDFARPRPLEMQCCGVGELLGRTRNVIQPQADEKKIQLVEACGLRETELTCDQEKVQQVLINLVHNAIQHTPEGGTVRLRVSSTPATSLLFEVLDSGQGIPEEMLGTVFKLFVSEREGGTGLGLAIARHIVQAHGGWIEATNPPEGGAAFRFVLPVKGNGYACSDAIKGPPAQ